jgi:hypothetical protein
MKRSTYTGKTFVASVLEPEVNTGLLVVCYPGSGEAFGRLDGSLLPTIKYGFDETKEWPFTILKVQTLTTNYYTAWAEIQKYIDDHSSAAVIVGWSLGAREAMDLVLGFQGRLLSSKVKLVVAIDGPGSGNPDYSKANVPVIMVSGKKGLYYYPLRTQEGELLKQNKSVKFIEMDLLDHVGLMRYTYSAQDIINSIIQLIQQPKEYTIVSTTVKNGMVTFTDDQGNKYSTIVNAEK